MYAKLLLPAGGGLPPLPCIVGTTSSPDLFGQLRQHGWAAYGQLPTEPESSALLITHRSLELVVAGQVLLADEDPWAPPGWWQAVDGLGGRCVVVVVGNAVRLDDPKLASKLRQMMDQSGSGVWALLPVEHPGSPLTVNPPADDPR